MATVVIDMVGNQVKFFHTYSPEFAFGIDEMNFINEYIDANFPFSAPIKNHSHTDISPWLHEHCQRRWTLSYATVWFESDIDGTHFRLRWN